MIGNVSEGTHQKITLAAIVGIAGLAMTGFNFIHGLINERRAEVAAINARIYDLEVTVCTLQHGTWYHGECGRTHR